MWKTPARNMYNIKYVEGEISFETSGTCFQSIRCHVQDCLTVHRYCLSILISQLVSALLLKRFLLKCYEFMDNILCSSTAVWLCFRLKACGPEYECSVRMKVSLDSYMRVGREPVLKRWSFKKTQGNG